MIENHGIKKFNAVGFSLRNDLKLALFSQDDQKYAALIILRYHGNFIQNQFKMKVFSSSHDGTRNSKYCGFHTSNLYLSFIFIYIYMIKYILLME
jgi:hypothetical protein